MNCIDIDNFITVSLKKNIATYHTSKKRLNFYSKIDRSKLGGRMSRMIASDIEAIEKIMHSENILVLYKEKTMPLMKQFMKIMKTPIRRENLKEVEKTKKKIVGEYIDVVKTCIPYELFTQLNIVDENSIDLGVNYCENCENCEDFIKENDVVICQHCYSEVVKMAYFNNRSFTFTSSKCNYDRVGHFKECLKQYQGKQNTVVSTDVYRDLENALVASGIVSSCDFRKTKTERFLRVNRSHVLYFLKELGYNKHYDDYVLIHSQLTGQPANDLSKIEDLLISDFEIISKKYTELYSSVDRKNFINIQYILYRLLIKHRHPFDPEDFSVTKSVDRKAERDKICKHIFKSLGWDYEDK